MIEGPPTHENPELDPNTLNFNQLEQAYRLARITFTQVDDGFRSVNGDVITIAEINGVFKIQRFPDGRGRQELHVAMTNAPHDGILRSGSRDKAQMMDALRDLLEQTGNRIIK